MHGWRWTFVALVMMAGSALADIYVVVHRDSPMKQATQAQIRDVYLGRVQSLPTGELLIPIERSEGPLRERFLSTLVGMSVYRFDAYWARLIFAGRVLPPIKVDDDNELFDKLRELPAGVGYTGREPEPSDIRVVLVLPDP